MSISTHSEKVTRYIDGMNLRREREEPSEYGLSGQRAEHAKQGTLGNEADPVATRDLTTFGLVELLLKHQRRLDAIARSPQAQRELIPRLLSIGLVGYAIFAATLAVVFSCAHVWPELTPIAEWIESPRQALIRIAPADGVPWSRWLDGSAIELGAAFALGLVGAIGICLPSFYFYSLLAGVRTTMLHVTTSALKGLASGAVALLGALPIYLAVVLGLVVFGAPTGALEAACLFGLLLPFVAGLYGSRSLYIGFLALADTLPEDRRCRRTCFLRRLLVAWSGCYTAVTPVMIFALWECMSR